MESRNDQKSDRSNKLTKTQLFLLDAFDFIEDISFFMANSQSYGKVGRTMEEMRELKSRLDRRERASAFYQVKQRQLIQTKKQGDKILNNLTKEGVIELLRARIISCDRQLPEGEICMVVFDVPEDIRRVRDSFRSLLKLLDFRMTQKSVWEGDLDVVDDLRVLIDLIGAQKFVRVYRALDVR